MPRLISAVGTVSYNGIEFPPALHSKVQARPAYSVGEVNRKYVHYTLSIDTVLTYTDPPLSAAVTAHQDMGSNSVQYRKLLTEPRKTLTFGEQGFGNFIVNNNGGAVPAGYRSVKDVAFGPKPRLLTWEPLGSNRSAHVSWTCETYLPECLSDSVRDEKVLLECTQESSFTINSEGLLTRTTKATLELASTVVSGSTMNDTIDAYVERFKPPVLQGFHRETHRQINRDHRILNITYTDTEISSDNPYAVGMVSMDMTHTVGSQLETSGFLRWLNTMSGTFRWAKGVPRSLAWSIFVNIARDRYGIIKPVPIAKDAGNRGKITRISIPHSISITEHLFNREASFSLSWISHGVDLQSVFESTGLFKPVRSLSWAAWHNSLATIQSPFGGSGIREKATNIKIVDVCGLQNANPEPEQVKDTYNPYGDTWFGTSCSSIKPEHSWVDAEYPMIRILSNSDVVPEFPAYGPPNGTVFDTDQRSSPTSKGFNPGSRQAISQSTAEETSFQNRYHNEHVLLVQGTLTRICYEPEVPIFKSYGDVPLVLRTKDSAIKKIDGQFFPIYVVSYQQTYHLSRLPQGNAITLLKTDAPNGDR